MASYRILNSKYYDKLQLNKLQTNNLISDNILPEQESFLFSVILNYAKFERNETGGILIFEKKKY